ncbi:hypothetical protein ACFY9C_02965 [Streptomyces filamentosus]|uniref:hypothetical protein n=1 Tax=Streptomyces filamentosus TaxID=67294 RepID=UPI0036E87B5D
MADKPTVVLVGHSYGGAAVTEAGDLPDAKAHASLASRPREICDLTDLAVRETS